MINRQWCADGDVGRLEGAEKVGGSVRAPTSSLYRGGHTIKTLILEDKCEWAVSVVWEHSLNELHRSWPGQPQVSARHCGGGGGEREHLNQLHLQVVHAGKIMIHLVILHKTAIGCMYSIVN